MRYCHAQSNMEMIEYQHKSNCLIILIYSKYEAWAKVFLLLYFCQLCAVSNGFVTNSFDDIAWIARFLSARNHFPILTIFFSKKNCITSRGCTGKNELYASLFPISWETEWMTSILMMQTNDGIKEPYMSKKRKFLYQKRNVVKRETSV